jgi:hypothetical protein
MSTARFRTGRTLVARLGHDEDLLAALTALAADEGIVVGAVQAIGALKEGRLAYYDQAGREYRELAVPGPVEIVSCSGTVSRRDGATAVHAHLCLADGDGATTGGHLVGGCRIFACEVVVTELLGPSLERGHDEVTGLPLWMGM